MQVGPVPFPILTGLYGRGFRASRELFCVHCAQPRPRVVNPSSLLFSRMERPCAFPSGAPHARRRGFSSEQSDCCSRGAHGPRWLGNLPFRGSCLSGPFPELGVQESRGLEHGWWLRSEGRRAVPATDGAVCGHWCGPGRWPPAQL